MNEETLLEDVRRRLALGDRDGAFHALYDAHASDVARFVALLRPAGPVEDVCQESWAAVVQSLPAFRFESTPLVWLFSIARRKAIDDRRRRFRDQAQAELDSRTQMLDRLPWGASPPTTPSSLVLRRERAAVLGQVLAGWPLRDRQLVELRFACDLKPREIAAVLESADSPNTISQRLVRLARRLRRQLLEHDVFASKRADE